MGLDVYADGGDKLRFQPDVYLAHSGLGPAHSHGRVVSVGGAPLALKLEVSFPGPLDA